MSRPTERFIATENRFLLPLVAVGLLFGLTGCYTQLAVVERDYDRPDYVEVEEHYEGEYGEDVVVRRYYEDDYYHYRPRRYRDYFDRFYVGIGFHWDPFYYDPFYDPWFGHGRYAYYSPFRRYYSPFVYAPTYVWGGYGYPYYGGWGGYYGTPYVVRNRGDYEPRGSTLGRSRLAGTRGVGGRSIDRGATGRGALGRGGYDTDGRTARTRGVQRAGSGGVDARSGRTIERSTRGTDSRGTVGRTPSSRGSDSRGTVGRSSSGSSSRSSGSVGRSSSGSSSSRSSGRSSSSRSRGGNDG